MIILEGPNGAGKTALAKSLAAQYEYMIHKFYTQPRTLAEFRRQTNESIALLDFGSVQDRCPMISDYIYAPFNAGRDPFIDLAELSDILIELDPELIYVRTQELRPRNPRPCDEDVAQAYDDLFEHLKEIGVEFQVYDHTKAEQDDTNV